MTGSPINLIREVKLLVHSDDESSTDHQIFCPKEKKKSSPIKLKPQAIVQPESPNALQSQRKQMKIEIFNEMNDLILQAKGIFDAIKGKIDEADEAIEFSATSLAKKVDSLQNDVKARDKKFDKLKKENCELKESLQKCNHEIEQMKTKAQDLESGMAE